MSQLNTSTELSTISPPSSEPTHIGHEEANSSDHTSQLPPTDGGRAAWRLLIAAYVFEALLWGFPLSYGVFQNYYSRLPQFRDNSYVTIVGTTASGICYLGAPFITPLVRRWSPYRLHMICIGWPLCISGLVAGSFADKMGTLVLTQGFMYGFGFLTLGFPIISMVDEYWVRRRGMAYGFLCSASGLSGTVMPLILQALLKKYGYQTTLRIIAVALVVLTGPLIPSFKGRFGKQQTNGLRSDFSFLKKPSFWIYSVSNLAMGFGYFFPSLYLPSYATGLGYSATSGALLLVCMSISQVAGQFTFGYLSDKKLSLNSLLIGCSFVTAAATLTVWGLARSLPPLVAFSILYGFFGAAYTAMWARIVLAVSDQPAASQAMFGLFNFGKGVGNVLAGPIGTALVRSSVRASGYGHGTYKAVVIFTGICWAVSAGSLSTIYWRQKK